MATVAKPTKRPASEPQEVLTLAEAAAYLRVSEDAVLDAIRRQKLPARKMRNEWRFLKAALESWLGSPQDRGFWNTQLGALKDDPYLEQMVEQIYTERGSPVVEGS
jgi:excisionase family DNA binding protein